ncbi:M48 family metalloprotease [Pseudohoeflea coraliihabitans]|uniref:M48 family metalloprotease n=1 Tax=Pseudohoeflea coraliihabitans TaxID=2860393 RepID=A0ABS6WV59_9HYPH|nr:M48 family metalloprotease [Pseudohoeflea sp. DP4N28-3]MBW3098940.1 M48 family metalloprotease [Pseudohoeflea sp. DP4N28-3]
MRCSTSFLANALPVRALARTLVSLLAGLAVLLADLPQPAQAQGRVAVVRDAEIEGLLADYARPILKAAGLEQRGIDIVLINNPSFNAFVAGRRIFINTGAIEAAETPNEIIGVLAHEAGHLAGGHQQRLREQLARTRTMAIVGSLLGVGALAAGTVADSRSGKSAGGALATAAPMMAKRMLLSYRRSEEINADQAAAKYLKATQQSARGMLATFERFSSGLALAGVRVDPYQQSHPLPRERIAMLQSLARESPYFDREDPGGLMQRHQMARAKIAAYMGGHPAVARLFGRGDASLAARYGDAVATDLAGNSAAALKKIDALIGAQPKSPYLREFKGEILLKLRRADEAAQAFEQALRLSGGRNGLIRARYGFALLASGKTGNATKAIENLRAGIQAEPDNLNAYLHLSQAYGLKGDIGNAELALAEGYFRAGNGREAKVFAARALAKLPKGTPAARRADDIFSVSR